MIFKDLLIINACIESGKIIAIDRKTGKTVWSSGGLQQTWSTPALMEGENGTLVLVSMKNKVLAFDAASGAAAWESEGVKDYICPTPIVRDGIAYIIGARKAHGLAVDAKGKVLWKVKAGSNVCSPVLLDGHLYFTEDDKQTAYCVDAASGKIVYEQKLDGRPGFYASAVLAGKNIYYVSRNNGTYVVSASPKFKLVAHNLIKGDDSVWNATPAVSGDKLLIRSGEALYCIGAK